MVVSSIEAPNSRSSFFPNSKTSDLQRSKALKKSPYLQRNDSARKTELDQLAKRDAKVDIPDAVKDFGRIKKAVDQAPEVDNSEKIARLKQQINAGQYNVDYEALADKILSSEY
tara:strand:+ start:20939 stop:21280 length:342 start_codon:yes stop_codon:yes gene_type:complete